MSQGHFPAMKVADQLQKDGRRVSFLIPQDAAPSDLINAPMGTKYMIGYALYTEAEDDPRRDPTEGERAVQRAGILSKTPEFQAYVHRYVIGPVDEEKAAGFIRQRCGVESRRELAANKRALEDFYEIEKAYRQWAAS